MSKAPCPYLGSHDANRRQRAPIDYPSFENSCLALAEEQSLLLVDQATFCLSGSYHYCQRYQALAAQETHFTADADVVADPAEYDRTWAAALRGQSAAPAALSTESSGQVRAAPFQPTDVDGVEEFFTAALLPAEVEQSAAARRPTAASRWYSWLAAALLFFAVIAVGGVFAAYTGWQMAVDRLATARTGQVNTLASGPVQQVQPLYVVMTVTAEPAAADLPQSTPALAARTGLEVKPTDPAATEANPFPPAVTATPIILVPLPTSAAGAADLAEPGATTGALIPTDTPVNLQLPPADSTATPVPVINLQVEIPTRRPTPAFDIPTSTPEVLELAPTATATLVPILGTPTIIFAADEGNIPPGECTRVRWHVENVRAVYYENQAAFGDGSQEECLRDEADTYALTVIFADGQTKIYTTSVGILWPTPTPSITPSFTPEVLPTETWTPVPPTATATPEVVYGTTFSINGDNPYRCSSGSQCNIGLLATNSGDSLDTLAIEIVAAGDWPALLCSQIGTCSGQRLVIANVGPGNTLFATLQLTVPADSVGQSTTYAIRSVSDGSKGTVTSQVTELVIESSE